MTKEVLSKKIKSIKNKYYVVYSQNKFRENKICEQREKLRQDRNLIIKISIINIVINIFMACLKLFAGYYGKSHALISDAFHYLSDILVNVIVILGVKISSKKEDRKFQYGYDRFECIASIILSFILVIVGIFIGYEGIMRVLGKSSSEEYIPNIVALSVSIFSTIVKILMFVVTFTISKKINSNILRADAWHHLSDLLSCVGIMICILSSMIGLKFMDNLASIVICLIIFKVSIDIFLNAVKKMLDMSAPDDVVEKIKSIIKANVNVKNIRSLKTRLFGNVIYVDIEIECSETLSLRNANKISTSIENEIELSVESIKKCTVLAVPEYSPKIEDFN